LPDNGDYVNFGKRLDIGLNVLAGYEFTEQLSAQLNGQFGLRNLHQVNPGGQKNDAKQNTIGFGISIGYRF
ncbi:MAG TPA: PorT family protein, partial [Niabella sp.]